MEKGACPRRAAHFRSRIKEKNERARSQQTDRGLLRQRLSIEHCGQHFKAGRIQGSLECTRQLGSVEESKTSNRGSRRAMNGSTTAALPRRSFGQTMRADVWWVQPLLVFIGLSTFIVYSTWAAFQGKNYFFGNYVSPFYSPELFGNSPHSWFGPKPGWWPQWLLFSPALLVLWAPGGFRLTCYYYRGAYYKAFWADPPACTVGEPRKSYWGERSFPLIMQNIHRYFLYIAILFLACLAYDVWKAMWFRDPATGQVSFGIGLGTLILA